MAKQSAKVELANLLIRKQGLIRTARDQLLHRDEVTNQQDYLLVATLEEILNAIDLAYNEPMAKKERE